MLVGAFNQEKAFSVIVKSMDRFTALVTTAATIHPQYYLLEYTKQSGYIIGTTTQHLENMKCDNFLFSLELIF